MLQFNEFEDLIPLAMRADQFSLRRFLKSIRQAQRAGKPFDRNLSKFKAQLDRSVKQREVRGRSVPPIAWPQDLPVVGRREEIAEVIRDHQVVVVCGETGSGKSTQLPKIALSIGRGVAGVIGHTQPRRIAARSIASRLSEELSCPLGKQVGYRIRFNDISGPETLIRLMTDGILLAETQSDRFLDQYDTIIIDEAHERSLNIDFLLGYLKRILTRREDLRVIITSATIDAARFAAHFQESGRTVPVVSVEGRTYPVEIRYRPPDSPDIPDAANSARRQARDWLDGVSDAVDEIAADDTGHILIFLPTERDIREASQRLSGRKYPGDSAQQPTQIVPLFGRLSMADQTKVFQPYPHRRIVLATNVAESSLTVPGIRFVIDTGTARISRYSARSRMQRLPIEAVSQASSRQRAGRCGRVGPGVCIRLYDEESFLAREEFTAPEIQRTSLAAVILRTLSLKLGNLEEFPFLDAPRPTTIREGYRTLEELGAIEIESTSGGPTRAQLTDLGRRMAPMPVDPRISRIILAAVEEHSLPEVLVIAAALETQDPRERPIEKQQAADEAHKPFENSSSDFLTLLNIWDAWHQQKQKLSSSQMKKWCQKSFLSWMRMREWLDVHRQLRDLLRDSGDRELKRAATLHPVDDRCNDFAAIHRALITGLLANLGFKSAEREFTGANGTKLVIWPGSALAGKPPKWFVAAELVETSNRYARTIARIQPEWIERLAPHLLKHEYSEPHWDANAGNVMAFEKVSLWGLPIVPRRKVAYAKVDPVKSRELLIQHGLVEFGLLYGVTSSDDASAYDDEQEALIQGIRSRVTPGKVLDPGDSSRRKGWGSDFPFLKVNSEILQQLQDQQSRTRDRNLMPTEDELFSWYDGVVPPDVSDRSRLKRWYGKARSRTPDILKFSLSQFTDAEQAPGHDHSFPAVLQVGTVLLPLTYQMEPGRDADGVTVSVPAEALAQLSDSRLSWLVPGMVEEKIIALVRSLPKSMRRSFVPVPDTVGQILKTLKFGSGSLLPVLAAALTRIAGEVIKPSHFDLNSLPSHLFFNIRVLDNNGKPIIEGRSLPILREEMRKRHKQLVNSSQPVAEEQQWHRRGFTAWDFAEVPASISITRAGLSIKSFPALIDEASSVALTLCNDAASANYLHRRGLRRLILFTEAARIKKQVKNLPQINQLRIQATAIRGLSLDAQLTELMADRAFLPDTSLPRSRQQFDECLQSGRNRLGIVAQEFMQIIPQILDQYHRTRRLLESVQGPGLRPVADRIHQQLHRLVFGEFLSATPWPWLIQFPRYFICMQMRVQRLNSGGLKTELTLEKEFAAMRNRYEHRIAQNSQQRFVTGHLDHYRWMLEEYCVAVFAGKLGTAINVSAKSLNEYWEKFET